MDSSRTSEHLLGGSRLPHHLVETPQKEVGLLPVARQLGTAPHVLDRLLEHHFAVLVTEEETPTVVGVVLALCRVELQSLAEPLQRRLVVAAPEVGVPLLELDLRRDHAFVLRAFGRHAFTLAKLQRVPGAALGIEQRLVGLRQDLECLLGEHSHRPARRLVAIRVHTPGALAIGGADLSRIGILCQPEHLEVAFAAQAFEHGSQLAAQRQVGIVRRLGNREVIAIARLGLADRRAAKIQDLCREQSVEQPAQRRIGRAEVVHLPPRSDQVEKLGLLRLEFDLLEAIEGIIALHHIAVAVLLQEGVDQRDGNPAPRPFHDQVGGTARQGQLVATRDARADLELEAAVEPLEDLEELLLGLFRQRAADHLFAQQIHHHQDLTVPTVATLDAIQCLFEVAAREQTAADQIVAKALAHQIGLHRNRIAVAQLHCLALLAGGQQERSRGAQTVESVKQVREGMIDQTASHGRRFIGEVAPSRGLRAPRSGRIRGAASAQLVDDIGLRELERVLTGKGHLLLGGI